jgi:hypothetical protein
VLRRAGLPALAVAAGGSVRVELAGDPDEDAALIGRGRTP